MRGARLCSMRNSFATVMARSGDGLWNGNVMSAFSANRRRILSLWLPRLPIDRIKRQLARSASPVDRHRDTALPLPQAGEVEMPSVVVIKEHNALVIHSL